MTLYIYVTIPLIVLYICVTIPLITLYIYVTIPLIAMYIPQPSVLISYRISYLDILYLLAEQAGVEQNQAQEEVEVSG